MGASEPDPKDTIYSHDGQATGAPTTVEPTLVSSRRADPAATVTDVGVTGTATLESPGQGSRADSLELDEKVQVGRFEIEQLLGRGGQGKVWLAQDPLLG